MKTSTRIALGVSVLCIVALLVWFARPKPMTDTDQIDAQIDTATTAATHHSLGGVLSVVSGSYLDQNNFTPDTLRLMIGQAFQKDPYAEVSMSQPLVTVTGNTATSDSTITIRDSSQGGNVIYTHPVHLDWSREKGVENYVFPAMVWRITGADYGPIFEGG